MSKPFSLNLSDLAKGAVIVVFGALIGGIQQALAAHGLDFAAYDWGFILNLAVSAGIGYLAKNFISDSDGKVLTPVGRIG